PPDAEVCACLVAESSVTGAVAEETGRDPEGVLGDLPDRVHRADPPRLTTILVKALRAWGPLLLRRRASLRHLHRHDIRIEEEGDVRLGDHAIVEEDVPVRVAARRVPDGIFEAQLLDEPRFAPSLPAAV